MTTAQDAHGPPFRALFTSYDAVLAQRGINADHDQVYFRFLLRMGESRKDDASLFDRFRDVLDQLGIEIEVDSEHEGVEEITRRFENLNAKETRAWDVAHANGSQRARRASFDTLYETFLDENDQDASHFGQTRLRELGGTVKRSASRASEPQGRDRSGSGRRAQARSQERASFRASSDNRYLPTNQISKSHHHLSDEHNNFVTKNSLEWRVPRNKEKPPGQSILTREKDVSMTAPKHHLDHDHGPSWEYRLLETQMLQDAEAFQDHHDALFARKLLWRWRNRATELLKHHGNLYKGALAYDRNTLLRQAWDQWRTKGIEWRQEVETKKFFQQLSLRAGKARDLFVLTKAFTHWAQSASDEILRTSVARRHILRTKYFNAWRDITVVNELKVRRQGLSKFFARWRHRAAVAKAHDIRALAFHDDKLVQNLYWKWFWKFCEHRAPLWAARRTKMIMFAKWANICLCLKERENWVSNTRAQSIQRKMIAVWRLRIRDISTQDQIADNYQRRRVLLNTLNSLMRHSALSPLLKRFTAEKIARTQAETINRWQLRANASQKAVEIRRSALIRDAWTVWNDRLRCEALGMRIDERIVANQFSQWVRASRYSLLSRIRQMKTLRSHFDVWVRRKREHERDVIVAQQFSRSKTRLRLYRLCLRKWRNALEGQRQRHHVALSIFASRSCKRYLSIWSRQLVHIEHINRQASDAQYYVVCTHAIRRWQSATETSRRQRRREAYATVRRRVKSSLIHRAFDTWRFRYYKVMSLNERAHVEQEQLSAQRALNLLRLWYQRVAHINEQMVIATDQHSKRLMSRSARFLSAKLAYTHALSDQATEFRLEMSIAAAAVMFKKLNWQAFQIERQNESATALRERNQEKHFRIMLRYWAEKAMSGRGRRKASYRNVEEELPSLLHGDLIKTEEEGKEDAALAKAEDWSALDTDLHLDLSLFPGAAGHAVDEATAAMAGVATSTPLPGYLRTPSKRTGRTKSRFKLLETGSRNFPFTPATAPAPVRKRATDGPTALITPFQRRLREQGYSERRPNNKDEEQFGEMPARQDRASGFTGERTTMQGGFVGGFEDILEDDQSRDVQGLGDDTIS